MTGCDINNFLLSGFVTFLFLALFSTTYLTMKIRKYSSIMQETFNITRNIDNSYREVYDELEYSIERVNDPVEVTVALQSAQERIRDDLEGLSESVGYIAKFVK